MESGSECLLWTAVNGLCTAFWPLKFVTCKVIFYTEMSYYKQINLMINMGNLYHNYFIMSIMIGIPFHKLSHCMILLLCLRNVIHMLFVHIKNYHNAIKFYLLIFISE